LLNAQPAAQNRLQRHAGKTVRLALPVFPQNLSLDENGRFFPQIESADTEPALILTPMPSALPLLLGDGKLADLFRVEGDGLFASDISGALADFDWVLALRPYLGDIAASRVDQFLQGLAGWRANAVESAGRNLAEYAVYEQAILAEPLAAREFIAEVDRLREDVDRLEARLALLENPS
jgi:ubiquinone biosynthesis protein UbiJ